MIRTTSKYSTQAQQVEALFEQNNAITIDDIKNNITEGLPENSTIKKWLKQCHDSVNLSPSSSSSSTSSPMKTTDNIHDNSEDSSATIVRKTSSRGEFEWRKKDYSHIQQQSGLHYKEILNTEWTEVKLPKGYEYNPSSLHCTEAQAWVLQHGTTIEQSLHMGVYQIKRTGTDQIRSKRLPSSNTDDDKKDPLVKLTSQNHIFPHAKMTQNEQRGNDTTKSASYAPCNIREGNANINGYLSDSIDPIFINQCKTLSNSTCAMIVQYSLNRPIHKSDATFKYTDDIPKKGKEYALNGDTRIVSSNMIQKIEPINCSNTYYIINTKQLQYKITTKKTDSMNRTVTEIYNESSYIVGPHKAYEAPEINLLAGPTDLRSMQTYSVPLYKLHSTCGELITCARSAPPALSITNDTQQLIGDNADHFE